MIESGVDQFNADGRNAENLLDRHRGLLGRPRAEPYPKQFSLPVPDTVARTFQGNVRRKARTAFQDVLFDQGVEGGGKVRLLKPTFRVPKSGEQRLPVEH